MMSLIELKKKKTTDVPYICSILLTEHTENRIIYLQIWYKMVKLPIPN